MSVLTQIQINTGSGDPVTADIGAAAENVSYGDTNVKTALDNAVKKLDDLTDVTIDNTLADGQTLVYDGTNHVFKNGESSSANKMDIDGKNANTNIDFTNTETFSVGGTTLSRFKVDEDGFISTAKNDVPIAFGKDEYGKYGYYKKDEGFLPFDFKSGYLDWNYTTPSGIINLPYNFYNGSAVVLNNEIHILGSGNSSSYTKHYKWNGTSWTEVSTLPYGFYSGSAVVLNNEIHILGGNYSSSARTNHYKWNGSTWVSVSTLPYEFYSGSAVVLNGEIHILGGANYTTNHYKWNGTSWTSTSVSTLPSEFYRGAAVVLNNEIHILGSQNTSYYNKFYRYAINTWTQYYENSLPYNFYEGSAVVLNNEIHILGGNDSSVRTNHYKWNGSTWVSVSTLPYEFYNGSAVVLNNEIHILGSEHSYTTYKNHYKWNGIYWTSVSTLPSDFARGFAVVLNNEIHISTIYENLYKWNGTNWINISTLPYDFHRGAVVVLNGNIWILGSWNSGTTKSYASSKDVTLDHLLPLTTLTSSDYYLGANHDYNDILSKIKRTMLSSANISIQNAGYGTLSGDTTGVDKTLSSNSPKILLLFTLEQNKNSKALRGMHAYAFAPYYASTAATVLTAARINVASSSSTGVTITTGSNTGLINIKCSSTAYTVKYWWFLLDNGTFL